MSTATNYEQQAARFLDDYGFKLTVKQHPIQAPPPWSGESSHPFQAWNKRTQRYVQITHGFRYVVSIERFARPPYPSQPHPHDARIGERFEFDFWGSIADKQKALEATFPKVPTPTAYDVLSGLYDGPLDADGVVEEFGDMKPSRAEEIAAFNRRVRAFFRDDELEALNEIN